VKTAVDTNVLFDLLLDDPDFGKAAQGALAGALRAGPVVVCPVVYAELAAHFGDSRELGGFLRDLGIRVEDFGLEALDTAAEAWRTYAGNRGEAIRCARCGHEFALRCPGCDDPVVWRQHLIADFLVGGHAQCRADALLTRDRGYFRKYFPKLRLMVPEQAPPATRRGKGKR